MIATHHQTISLTDLNAVAALHTRRDRKYLLDHQQRQTMLDSLGPDIRVLDIDGLQHFRYESIYFDTAALDLFRAAATGRRRRYKVRTRTYVDTGTCMLEVKTKGQRGQTAKHRLAYDPTDRDQLTDVAQQFIADAISTPPDDLMRALTTTYDRSTFVDLSAATRLTVDHNLVCTDWAGNSVRLDAAVVETKSANAPSPADRWLWAAGIRPAKISKFSTGLAALHPTLPSNKWHRTLQHNWQQVEPATVKGAAHRVRPATANHQ